MIDCSPDFARTADDYARYRAGFPLELLDRLVEDPLAVPHRVWAVTAQALPT